MLMKKLLHIIASPREEESRTLQVSKQFLDAFQNSRRDFVIDTLDLPKEELPPLSVKTVSGKYTLMQGKDLFGTMRDSWAEILQYIEQFLSADIYLISAPMWNFSIPYLLKHYIDLIVQPKYLFSGTEGLVKGKKMIVITSRGGTYAGQSHAMDFQEPYLRAVFGFVGITDITFINAEGMDISDGKEERLQKAMAAAKQLGAQ